MLILHWLSIYWLANGYRRGCGIIYSERLSNLHVIQWMAYSHQWTIINERRQSSRHQNKASEKCSRKEMKRWSDPDQFWELYTFLMHHWYITYTIHGTLYTIIYVYILKIFKQNSVYSFVYAEFLYTANACTKSCMTNCIRFPHANGALAALTAGSHALGEVKLQDSDVSCDLALKTKALKTKRKQEKNRK